MKFNYIIYINDEKVDIVCNNGNLWLFCDKCYDCCVDILVLFKEDLCKYCCIL